MPTKPFSLHIHADEQGRTCVALAEPNGKTREPVPLTLHGERALYGLMEHVRAGEVRPLDLLEEWRPLGPAEELIGRKLLAESVASLEKLLDEKRQRMAQLSPEEIEEAIRKCGL